MATKEEVQSFLNQMKEKIKVFGIIYRDDRGKNAQTLVDLEICKVHSLEVTQPSVTSYLN